MVRLPSPKMYPMDIFKRRDDQACRCVRPVARPWPGLLEEGMAVPPSRKTYRHGNLRAAALTAAWNLVASGGQTALSMRQVSDAVGVAHRALYNHFRDRDELLDAVAAEAFKRLATQLAKAKTPREFTVRYVRFALAHPTIYALSVSRPHGTMKHNPSLQAAAHLVITEAMRVYCGDMKSSVERRRAVMKILMIHYGGISLYAAGVLDLSGERALVAELAAMTAPG
ncbi:TetR/AcrR family transcriptional regulator [Ferrovibrio sp.]|uniref:TetR/AcrR family transcriptional regulator n=1 Tax=Ferrovibrio sp. TaxID=1917215 RepID=UPI0035B4C89B